MHKKNNGWIKLQQKAREQLTFKTSWDLGILPEVIQDCESLIDELPHGIKEKREKFQNFLNPMKSIFLKIKKQLQ